MQESIAEALMSKIRDRMSTLRIGPPLDKAIDIGAIVARVQLDRIERIVAQGVADGATCWQPQVVLPARGFYYPPTLLSNVHPTSIVAQQEIFGPVLAAMTFRTPKEAVELANNTVYGLASCVWSENINVALQVAAQIKAGVVWVNCTKCSTLRAASADTARADTAAKAGVKGCSNTCSQRGSRMLRNCMPRTAATAARAKIEEKMRASRPSIARSSSTSAASRRVLILATAWKCARSMETARRSSAG